MKLNFNAKSSGDMGSVDLSSRSAWQKFGNMPDETLYGMEQSLE